MKRRDSITLISGAATAWPLIARARQPKVRTIGVLARAAPGWQRFWKSFPEVLRELGYIEGQNIRFEFRSDEEQMGRLFRIGNRIGATQSRCDRALVHAGRSCREASDPRNSDCLRALWRHGRNRAGREPGPAGGKCHWTLQPQSGAGRKNRRPDPRDGAFGASSCCASQCTRPLFKTVSQTNPARR